MRAASEGTANKKDKITNIDDIIMRIFTSTNDNTQPDAGCVLN
jgi:hypothetical protein